MTEERTLVGGLHPGGGPVRVGDTVRRAPAASSPAVRELLLHLEAVGFEGAPRHLGTDERGREILSWMDGDVPLPPYPAWAMTERALADLGGLVRRLHDATASFDRGRGADWATDWADPGGGPVVCHNDLFPENVVFRAGRVVGLIDFAMAAPGRTLWDIAIAAQLWAPLGDPTRRDQHPPDLDGIARFGVLVRAYGLDAVRAEDLLAVLAEERRHSGANIRAEIAAGNRSWLDHWTAAGGDERAAADDAWIAAHRAELIAAVRA